MQKVKNLFSGQRLQHGASNCENFEEVSISDQTFADLARLQIRCAYAPNGCRAISLYNNLERHEGTCEFEMVPCELCEYPLSRRPPIVQHTQRACFEYMRYKNPAGIQQQFMILFNTMEEVKAENHRLQAMVKDINTELKDLNSACAKKNSASSK